MSACVIPGRQARLRLPTGLHHAIITLPKPKKCFNPLAGFEPLPMRQWAPEPNTFLMRSNCVLAIATSSLLVRSCKLLCSCRDAARRRCHEFRPDWIGDCFAQDPVDLSLDGRIEPPARHLVDRLQLVGMTRRASEPDRYRCSRFEACARSPRFPALCGRGWRCEILVHPPIQVRPWWQ
jgi:hypothetical protein